MGNLMNSLHKKKEVKKIQLTEKRKKELFEELGLNSKLPIVLVFGGSQGAKAINDAINVPNPTQ